MKMMVFHEDGKPRNGTTITATPVQNIPFLLIMPQLYKIGGKKRSGEQKAAEML